MSAYWQNVSEGFAFVGMCVGLLGCMGSLALVVAAVDEGVKVRDLIVALSLGTLAVSLLVFSGAYLAVSS